MRAELPLDPEDVDSISLAYPIPTEKSASCSTDIANIFDISMASFTAGANRYGEWIDFIEGSAMTVELWLAREPITESVEISCRLHEAIKKRIRQGNPSLKARLSHKEVIKLMDALSEKLARSMPFTTWQEAMAFIRGKDRYDSERQ